MLYYEITVETKNNPMDAILQSAQKEVAEKSKDAQAIPCLNQFTDMKSLAFSIYFSSSA